MRRGQDESFAKLTPPGTVPKITSIFDVSADFLAQLRLWLEQNPPAIGITNILGFSQFTAQTATTVTASETTTSTSYVDLATVGPTLTNLPDGQYLFIYSCLASCSIAGDGALMAPNINGAAPNDNDSAATNTNSLVGISAFTTATLSSGANTVKLQYKSGVGASTATFLRRRLVGFRYANK